LKFHVSLLLRPTPLTRLNPAGLPVINDCNIMVYVFYRHKAVIKKKLVIVGDGQCGKTCLLQVFSNDKFPADGYLPTIFETYVAEMVIDEQQVSG